MSDFDSNNKTLGKGSYSDTSSLEQDSNIIGYYWGCTDKLEGWASKKITITGSADLTSGSILGVDVEDEETLQGSKVAYRIKALQEYFEINIKVSPKKVEKKLVAPDDVSYSARVLQMHKDFIKVEVFDPSNEQFSEKMFEPELFDHLDKLEEGDYILLRRIKRPGNISLSILDGEKLVPERIKNTFEDYSEFSYLDEIDLPSTRKDQ